MDIYDNNDNEVKADYDGAVLDNDHCNYVLTDVLPKSVDFITKIDLNCLYYHDIISYQKENCQQYTSNHAECREFLVNKAYQYFEQVIQLILTMKPSAYTEFCEVSIA